MSLREVSTPVCLLPYTKRWEIRVGTLGLYTAERAEGTEVRFLADPDPERLAERLAAAEAEG
jgi:hypothetical protein